jgi:hypothetical protein
MPVLLPPPSLWFSPYQIGGAADGENAAPVRLDAIAVCIPPLRARLEHVRTLGRRQQRRRRVAAPHRHRASDDEEEPSTTKLSWS